MMAEMRDAGSKIQDVGRQLRALADLDAIVSDQEQPTVLVEGTRQLPWQDWELVCRMGEFLARRYPAMLFRTGNATGSDEAFAEGVARVDPSRIQYVIPHPGMGRKRRYPQARTAVLADVPTTREGELASHTLAASPTSDRLVQGKRDRSVVRRSHRHHGAMAAGRRHGRADHRDRRALTYRCLDVVEAKSSNLAAPSARAQPVMGIPRARLERATYGLGIVTNSCNAVTFLSFSPAQPPAAASGHVAEVVAVILTPSDQNRDDDLEIPSLPSFAPQAILRGIPRCSREIIH